MKKINLRQLFALLPSVRLHKTEQDIRSLSPLEHVLFWFFVAILLGSTLFLLFRVNEFLIVEVPRQGGSIVEGVVGSPRFINPLLSTSNPDRDLAALVYTGLLRATAHGELRLELAESYSVSENGLLYTFLLREDIFFHDGTPVTAEDVVFSVRLAQDPVIKSPRRASWEGVFVEQIGEKEVRFTLDQPYSPFLENATLGILPVHIWGNVGAEQFPFSQLNVEPVGAGPYQIKKIKRNNAGLPESYELAPFGDYAGGKPYIDSILLRFYTNESDLIKAYQSGEVESINSISPERALQLPKARIEDTPLPRIFAIFFNQNQESTFSNQEVRRALDMALDKERIVREVLGSYGVPLYNPIPPGVLVQSKPDYTSLTPEERLRGAREILEINGWTLNEEEGVLEKETDDSIEQLRFSLTTSNSPELKAVATIAKEEWERLGAQVELQFFDTADLNINVIRPRRYDALLFGEIVGRELDLFAFWHSSQRNDPGLNIALYANITTDKLLEDARSEPDREVRLEQLSAFEEEVRNDIPAVFVYSPNFIYIVPEKLRGLELGIVTTPADRFLDVHEWFIRTDNVWSFFTKNMRNSL